MKLNPSACIVAALVALSGCSGGSTEAIEKDMAAATDSGADAGSEADALDVALPPEVAPELLPEMVQADTADVAAEAAGDLGILPGEPGAACTGPDDCYSQVCILTGDGKKCSLTCEQECPFGWECAIYVPSLPDEVYVCAEPFLALCRPCRLNTDCTSVGVATGQVCVPYADAGSFCGELCGQDKPCPTGYSCADTLDATGAAVTACTLAQGECPCKQWFADEGASTDCKVTNEWGSCPGQRACTADGLTACDAPAPAQEACNAADDNCNGAIDEGTGGAACTVENEIGSCPGTEVCLGGNLSCDGPEPEPEVCDGLDNNCDGTVDEGFADTDGDGTADCLESDKDGDGLLDGKDNCPMAANPAQEDFDLDGAGDACDLDDDNDLVADGDDCKPFDPDVKPGAAESCDGKDNNCNDVVDEGFPDSDGDGKADCLDDDSDGDGISNGADNCPAVANPGQEDQDSDLLGDACDPEKDGDGVPNMLDNCPGTFNPKQDDLDQDSLGDACDLDDDGDGADDLADNCPAVANPGQEDLDQDGAGDLCDPDDDGDGVPDALDNCPKTANPLQEDVDKDGVGNACEMDADGDLVPDPADNCPLVSNPEQQDLDNDGTGDACDSDDDGDGVADTADNCPIIPNPGQGDLDQDGSGDACDPDDDGDGVVDAFDNCAGLFNPAQADLDNDGVGDACDSDDDGDGVADAADNCPITPNPGQEDLDQDGSGNACDLDDDGDGDPDALDCKPLDPAVNHAAVETCDGLDNNCQMGVDEGFPDFDLDGFKNCVDPDDDDDGDPDVTDCASLNPLVHHGAKEACNGVDDDCFGGVDDGFGQITCGKGVCLHSVPACDGGKTQVCDPFLGASVETCNGKDDDCNGMTDEGLGSTTCGKGVCLHTVQNCAGGWPQACDPMDGALAETCDGQDDDCDGLADEGLGNTTCGLGICLHSTPNCVDGLPTACDPMDGAQLEACDGLDNDCDGDVDEQLGATTCGKGACNHEVAYCAGGKVQVCDPLQGASAETCDGIDNDCDGNTDEELGSTSCGLGVCKHSVANCVDGKVQTCDPFAGKSDEACDQLDNDCDGQTDEGAAACSNFYKDLDGDGWGTDVKCLCAPEGDYDALLGNDCDDTNIAVHPTAVEVCNNSVDEDCDGIKLMPDGLKNCKEIRDTCPGLPSGSYTIRPLGNPITVQCQMSYSGGGWTQMTDSYLAAMAGGGYEYLYVANGAWYRSPKTDQKWSWSTYTPVNGSYAYATGTNPEATFACTHGEQGYWGVGCSNCGGSCWKCFVHGAGLKDTVNGQTTICQDKPNVFGYGACGQPVQIYVRQ